jgi:hypothetical protein
VPSARCVHNPYLALRFRMIGAGYSTNGASCQAVARALAVAVVCSGVPLDGAVLAASVRAGDVAKVATLAMEHGVGVGWSLPEDVVAVCFQPRFHMRAMRRRTLPTIRSTVRPTIHSTSQSHSPPCTLCMVQCFARRWSRGGWPWQVRNGRALQLALKLSGGGGPSVRVDGLSDISRAAAAGKWKTLELSADSTKLELAQLPVRRATCGESESLRACESASRVLPYCVDVSMLCGCVRDWRAFLGAQAVGQWLEVRGRAGAKDGYGEWSPATMLQASPVRTAAPPALQPDYPPHLVSHLMLVVRPYCC